MRYPGYLLAACCLLLSLTTSVMAIEKSADHQHHAVTPRQESGGEVGLDERLGSRIDPDALFRDENGKTVRLGDLISGPTIILPVYYSCTNVCNYMQGGLARILPALKNRPVQTIGLSPSALIPPRPRSRPPAPERCITPPSTPRFLKMAGVF